MIATDLTTAGQRGQKSMRAGQSSAERVFWPMQAGRPREAKPSLVEATHIGRTAANKLRDAIHGAGLSAKDLEDYACVLLCERDGSVKPFGPFTEDNQDSNDLEMARRILRAKAEPLGVAFFLKDYEKKSILVHARPFERNERTERGLSAFLDDWEYDFKKGRKLKVN